MASKGFIGKGTIFSIGSGGAGETFTPVAQLKTAQWGGQKINFEDISNLDSPVLGTSSIPLKENMPATGDPGTVDVAGIFLPGDLGQLAVAALWESLRIADFKVQLPKGPTQTVAGNLYTFSGYLAENPLPDIQWDKVVTIKMKIQLASDITLTAGS